MFGPLIAFGTGGINVEVVGDVRFRIAPLSDRDVDALLHEIRGLPLLTGFRGRPAADVDALRDVLLRISQLAERVPEISELDLNPVVALAAGAGCRVIDARIKVAAEPPRLGGATGSLELAAIRHVWHQAWAKSPAAVLKSPAATPPPRARRSRADSLWSRGN